LGGLRFRVSPGAFFQVNTAAAEAMYDVVRRLAVLGAGASSSTAAVAGAGGASLPPLPHLPSVALLDVCCGTGTIALLCAPHFGRVVGVEVEAAAVRDAAANAALNRGALGGTVTFLCERAEVVMEDVIARATAATSSAASGAGSDEVAPSASSAGSGSASNGLCPIRSVVAVVNPPRGGLHPAVIRALRSCRPLARVVYVSCNPTGSLVEDAVRLCMPSEPKSAYARGLPFAPRLAVPVDMFPQTRNTELVMVFERDGGI